MAKSTAFKNKTQTGASQFDKFSGPFFVAMFIGYHHFPRWGNHFGLNMMVTPSFLDDLVIFWGIEFQAIVVAADFACHIPNDVPEQWNNEKQVAPFNPQTPPARDSM